MDPGRGLVAAVQAGATIGIFTHLYGGGGRNSSVYDPIRKGAAVGIFWYFYKRSAIAPSDPDATDPVTVSYPASFPQRLLVRFTAPSGSFREGYFLFKVALNRFWYTSVSWLPFSKGNSREKIVRANIPLYTARIAQRIKTEPVETVHADYESDARDLYDTAMSALHEEYVTQWDDIAHVRSLMKLSTKIVRPIDGHPHKNRARDRQVALNTMEEIAQSLNLTLYSVSTGPREDKRGWDGSHDHHFPIDMRTRRRVDPVSPDKLICFVDVDYYVDLETFERYAGHKIAIFTVHVDAVGGCDGESLWYVEGSTFHENIAGGGKWTHPVWHYSGDLVTIRDRRAALALRDQVGNCPEVERLEEMSGHVVYHVERIRFPGTNKMIVMLNPSFSVALPWHFTCLRFGVETMEQDQLYQMSPVSEHTTSRGSFRIGIFGGSHPYVSISYMEPTRHSLKLPLNEWQGLVLRAKGVRAWGAEIVDSHMKNIGHKLPAESVMLLAAALIDIPENIHFVGYTADMQDLHDDIKDVAKLVVPPVLPPATSSAQTSADMARSIDNFSNVRNTVVPPDDIRAFAKEFSAEVASRTSWTTLSHDETIEVMLRSNPARKAEIEKFVDNPCNTESYILAAIKAECIPGAAGKSKKARIILPQTTYELYASTRYIKPWSEQAHKRGPNRCGHWFVCGSDPDEIADAVVRDVRAAEENGNVLTPTDYIKYDLSHSAFSRDSYVDSAASSCMNTNGEVNVREVLQWEVNKTIIPKIKNRRNHPKNAQVKSIKSGHMNLSGAADTTALNTYTNGMFSYITLRRKGVPHLIAFEMIRSKYGDDGLEEFVEEWLETIKICGFAGTIEARESNEEPISFLSRIYIKPLITNTSICDPKRALMKLPTTCSTRPVYLARRDKALGYATVDGTTPLVGNYARAILRVYGQGSTKFELGPLVDPVADSSPDGPIRCLTSEGRELKRKMDRGPHPYCDDYDDVAIKVVANKLGMCVEEVEQLCDAYDNARTPEDLTKLVTTEMSEVAPDSRALRIGFEDLV